MRLPHPAGLSLGEVVRRTYREVDDDDVLSYAAAMAFHAMLALFPFLVFLLALLTFLHLPGLFGTLLGWARAALPAHAMRRVTRVVQGFEQAHNGGLLSLGMAGALWAASGGMRSAMSALNRAYDVQEGRAAWKRYLLSIGYTVALGIVLLIAVAVLALGPGMAAWLGGLVRLGSAAIAVWTWVRFPIAGAALVLLAALAYALLPDVKGFRLLTAGSVTAVVVWLALSLAFRFYLSRFGNYNVLYGSLGAVVVLLLYLWLSSIALLLGGELDAVLEEAKQENARRR